jgi:hypothetical protein
MPPRATASLEQLPIPPASVESARLLAKIGASMLGDTCMVMLADGARLVPIAIDDRDPTAVARAEPLFEPMPLDRCPIAKAVLVSGVPACGPVEVADVRANGSRAEAAFVEAIGAHSYLIVPLRPGLGVLVFVRHRHDRSRFYREHVQLAVELAAEAAPKLDLAEGTDVGVSVGVGVSEDESRGTGRRD